MSIFKDLNDVQLDVNEYEEIPLSPIAQKRIIHHTHKKLQSKKTFHFKKNTLFTAIATFVAAFFITINIAFPTFAEKLPNFTNIFDFFINNEHYIFEEYNEHATYIGQTKENSGISITITNAVYDKENITIAYTIESEQDLDLGERPALFGEMKVARFGNQYNDSGYFEKYIVEKVNDHQYAVLYIYELISGPKPETVHISWNGDTVINLNNVNQSVSGYWDFNFTLQALESNITKFASKNIKSNDAGVEITLKKMTQSPISTTIYLAEKVEERIVSQEEQEFRSVFIEYFVADDLGNEYSIIHYRDTGHSTDFQESHISTPRITINVIDKDASYIYITPIVNVGKVDNPDENGSGTIVPVMAPYEIEPIRISLNK